MADIKDNVEYYIDTNQEPGFVEDELIYETLDPGGGEDKDDASEITGSSWDDTDKLEDGSPKSGGADSNKSNTPILSPISAPTIPISSSLTPVIQNTTRKISIPAPVLSPV